MTKIAVCSISALTLSALVCLGAGCAAETGPGSESTGTAQQAVVATQSFTATYTSWSGGGFGNGSCNSNSYNGIKGYEPTDGATHPVFVFLTGTQTSGSWDQGLDEDLIQYMAGQGFVAATVQYNNTSYPTACGTMTTKASCIYNTSSSSSAISKLCSRATANCAAGIYVSGISQGANMSSLAANYGANMKAAYLISNGDVAESLINLSGCLDKSHVSFASSQLRAVSGEADQIFGGNQAGVQSQQQKTNGVTCAKGTYDCLQADGSGWRIVHNSECQDGTADHCYILNGANSTCSNSVPLDTGWDTGSVDWEKNQDLAWLLSK